MRYEIIFAAVALLVLTACQAPCPPGTVLSDDGICIEEGAPIAPQEPAQAIEPKTTEENKTVELIEPTKLTAPVEKTEEPQESTANESEQKIIESSESEYKTAESSPEEGLSVMDKLKKTYETKVIGYRFDYDKGTYRIRDGILKIDLREPHHKSNIKLADNTTRQLVYYDTVYHDLATGKTVAYCEGINSDLRSNCQKLKIEDVPISVDFAEFAIKMPHEWLYELSSNGTIQGAGEDKYYLDGRAVTRVAFSSPKTEAYFDPQNGLPLKIELEEKGMPIVIAYKNLAVNDVKEDQMKHRSFTEIPFSEIAR